MKNKTTVITILLGAALTLSAQTSWSMGKKIPPQPPTPVTPKPTPTPTPKPTPKPTPAPTPTTPTAGDATPLWEAQVSGSKAWTAHLHNSLDTLGQDILDVIPADAQTFCANYENLSYAQRKQFWVYLISYMVKRESSFKTNSTYTEGFNDSNGDAVISRGLLQISIESGNSYGCGLKKATDLHDPLKNLDCGVRILNRWLGRDGRIAGKVSGGWKGGARYWAVLRTTSGSYNTIVSGVSKLSMCKR